MKKRTVAPFYAVAGVWLYFALFRELYAPSHYITALLVSLAAIFIARAIWPTRVFALPDTEPPAQEAASAEPSEAADTADQVGASDPKIEALIKERNRAIGEMHRLNAAIEDPTISSQIDRLETLAAGILDHVVAHPEKLPQIRKFLQYYLPTTIKLLNAYDRMGSAGVSGENIDGTMQKIEDMLQTILLAFEKQLDALFAGEAMDISSDITVLETLLVREGLSTPKS